MRRQSLGITPQPVERKAEIEPCIKRTGSQLGCSLKQRQSITGHSLRTKRPPAHDEIVHVLGWLRGDGCGRFPLQSEGESMQRMSRSLFDGVGRMTRSSDAPEVTQEEPYIPLGHDLCSNYRQNDSRVVSAEERICPTAFVLNPLRAKRRRREKNDEDRTSFNLLLDDGSKLASGQVVLVVPDIGARVA